MAARLLGFWALIPPGAWTFVCCECCMCRQVMVSATSWSLVQRSPTDCGLSSEGDRESLKSGGHDPESGRSSKGKKNNVLQMVKTFYHGVRTCNNHCTAPSLIDIRYVSVKASQPGCFTFGKIARGTQAGCFTKSVWTICSMHETLPPSQMATVLVFIRQSNEPRHPDLPHHSLYGNSKTQAPFGRST